MKHRRSIRLREYDYRSAGAYFVTICTFEREELLGGVEDGVMRLNVAGRLVEQVWVRTANGGRKPEAHDLVVMPNHVHGIIWLARPPVGARRPPVRDESPSSDGMTERSGIPKLVDDSSLQRCDKPPAQGYAARSLAARVAAFKSQSARAINRLRRTPGAPVWQRNYYERIIRNERELFAIKQYILDNPLKWVEDPGNVG